MIKKRNIEILLIGIFVIVFGVWLFSQSLSSFLYFLKEGSNKITLSQLITESILMLFTVCLVVSGISFLMLKKWSLYFIRTCLLLLIAVGLMVTLSTLFIGFVGLPPISFYLIMFAEIVSLYLIARPKVKEQFSKR